MHNLTTLEKLGLSETEAAVFMFLVQNGSSRAPQLQTALDLKKVAVYRALNTLMDMSLVVSSGDRRLQIYTAEPLQRLLDGYDQNMQQMHRARADLEKLISELAKQENQLYKERKVRVYEGVEGLRLWYEERLRSDVTSIIELGPECPALYLKNPDGSTNKSLAVEVRSKRIKQGIPIRCLFTVPEERAQGRSRTRKDYLRETRALETITMPDVCLSVFGTKFGFYSANDGLLRGMIIDDPMLANSIAMLFDVLWQQGKTI